MKRCKFPQQFFTTTSNGNHLMSIKLAKKTWSMHSMDHCPAIKLKKRQVFKIDNLKAIMMIKKTNMKVSTKNIVHDYHHINF